MFEDSSKVKAYVKVAVFGDGGAGKTRFLLSFPKIAVVDTEKGTNPYRGKYEFMVKQVSRWKELGAILDYLEKNPGLYETLAIDSLTVFYQDLINEMIEFVKNRRGHEILSQAEWSIIKRRWASFLNRLIDLPMHVVLSMRERDEYEDTVDRKGEDVRKKTGNQLMDADKQTKYIFDLVLRAYTEENKKEKESKFFVRVDKTRYDWMPKYSTYNITGKRAFAELFEPRMKELQEGLDAKPRPRTVEEAQSVEHAAEVSTSTGDVPAPTSTGESVGDILGKFAAPASDPAQAKASGEDIKVLMTRCGKLKWSDGGDFKSADGKALIKSIFKVEGTKELSKPQVDWLYEMFGKVLSGAAQLVRDEKGIPWLREGSPAATVAAS